MVDLKKGAVTKGIFLVFYLICIWIRDLILKRFSFLFSGPYEGRPDVILSFVDSDFLGVATGKLNAQMLFLRWVLITILIFTAFGSHLPF